MELLPLSYVNQFAYCPRRFWYMYVEGEMVENAHVTRGVVSHERVHTEGYETTAPGVVTRRAVHVYSRDLGVSGICDVVEEDAAGNLTPVEYKQGRRGQWQNDHAQLCAQALCLEEMSASAGRPPIDRGFLFYFGSRRRVEVAFTPELRHYTHALIQAIQHALAKGEIPAHTQQQQRCRGCSLIDICLPEETKLLSPKSGVNSSSRA